VFGTDAVALCDGRLAIAFENGEPSSSNPAPSAARARQT